MAPVHKIERYNKDGLILKLNNADSYHCAEIIKRKRERLGPQSRVKPLWPSKHINLHNQSR